MSTFDAGLKTGLGVGHDVALSMGCVGDDDLRNRGKVNLAVLCPWFVA
jgi:hypothetical protein